MMVFILIQKLDHALLVILAAKLARTTRSAFHANLVFNQE